MIKKSILGLISIAMITSSVGCSTLYSQEQEELDLKVRNIEEKAEDLEGEWSSDLTREEATALYNEILPRIEEATRFYGLDTLETYVSEEKVSEEKGLIINDSYIDVIIEEPDFNRLEGLYFGFKQYGSDLSSGEIELKLTSVLDKDIIKEEGFYSFEETSFARFSEDFMGEYGRDYTELNEQIYNMIINEAEVQTVENNLNGVRETISITDNILLYKLETKEYQFLEESENIQNNQNTTGTENTEDNNSMESTENIEDNNSLEETDSSDTN